MGSLPPMVKLIRSCSCYHQRNEQTRYKYGMLVLTFFGYMSYHLSRKPLSVVKGQLHHNCSAQMSEIVHVRSIVQGNSSDSNSTWCDFPPFDKSNYKTLYGDLDYAFLVSYAFGMFFSGMIAERMSLRYFLTIGMLLSGIFTAMFGIGDYAQVHVLSFYIVSQVLNGLVQASGWPGVVTCVGNWFGKSRRGLIMGVWNSHTSVGNILGSVIASAFVATNWGLSFIVPGAIIGAMGLITFLFLIDSPTDLSNATADAINNYHPVPSVTESDLSDEENRVLSSGDDDGVGKPQPATGEEKAIGFISALKIPGVVEFSISLFFAKLVSYTFLFWLPLYIQNTSNMDTRDSSLLSTLFDVGGIAGGIAAGLFSDRLNASATTCVVMLLIGAGMMYLYEIYASVSSAVNIVLLLITGCFINGPYALITTAVSADLGTHQVLRGNAKALSTVTAIIDGTGSIGAAFGPYLTGVISDNSGWKSVFYMLIGANIAAVLLLTRLVMKEGYPQLIYRWVVTKLCCCSSPSNDRNGDEVTALIREDLTAEV